MPVHFVHLCISKSICVLEGRIEVNTDQKGFETSRVPKCRVEVPDYDITTKPCNESNNIWASSPSFKNVYIDWQVGTGGVPSSDIQQKTAITWYKLAEAE